MPFLPYVNSNNDINNKYSSGNNESKQRRHWWNQL